MTLLELYKVKNNDPKWRNSHSSLASGAHGRLFEYTNTNFRTQAAFGKQFAEFLAVENKPRSQWGHQHHHNQELDKHRVVNMLQSKLFKKEPSGLYKRTAKGLLYSDFVNNSADFDTRSNWLINYLFLINGYYNDRRNYIIARTRDLLNYYLSVSDQNPEQILAAAKQLLATNNLNAAVSCEFFYMHSFYDDTDFLEAYQLASSNEKSELADYILANLKANNKQCTVSIKYQRSGNFNHNMLVDETKVFLLSLKIVTAETLSIDNFYSYIIDQYKNYISSEFSHQQVQQFVLKNQDVFGSISQDIIEPSENTETKNLEEQWQNEQQIETFDLTDKAEEYLDETSMVGKQKIKAVYAIRKKQARVLSNYTCALESLNNCKQVYFTAKATGKNYLELHHLIPREFRNDFAYSIEVLANYITLCPRCHRQIHLATDREREALINWLHADRKDRLCTVN